MAKNRRLILYNCEFMVSRMPSTDAIFIKSGRCDAAFRIHVASFVSRLHLAWDHIVDNPYS